MQWAQSRTTAILFATLTILSPALAHPQTTLAASLYGAFNGSSSGNGVVQSPANQAGGLFELRQIRNPLVGYEAAYSYNRANQTYLWTPPVTCGLVCAQTQAASVSANAHQLSGAWIASFKIAHFTPFALAGGGILWNVPSSATLTICPTGGSLTCATSSTSTSTSTNGVFVYGAGLDWKLAPRLGLRLQYRGNLYKAAALANAFYSTNSFTQTAEPMIGVFFRP